MPNIAKSSLLCVVVAVGLIASGREAIAQSPTYIGTFAMTNASTNKCTTATLGSFGFANGVVGNPWAAAPSQQWAFLRLTNGFYAIMDVTTNQFMTTQPSIGPAQIIEAKWTAGLYQQWYLYPIPNEKNFYALVNVGSGQMMADTRNASSSGGSITTTQWTNNLNQWWYLYFLRD